MTLDSFRATVRRARQNSGQVWMNSDDADDILIEAGLLATSTMIDGLIIHRDATKARGLLEFSV